MPVNHVPFALAMRLLASVVFLQGSVSFTDNHTMARNRSTTATAPVAHVIESAPSNGAAPVAPVATAPVIEKAIEATYRELLSTYPESRLRIAHSFLRAFVKHESALGRVRVRDAENGASLSVNKAGRKTRNGWKDGHSGTVNSGKGRSQADEDTMKLHRSLELLGEKMGFDIE